MTVAENVEYGLRVAGVAKAERAQARGRGPRDGPPGRLRGPQAGRALGRPAPARGACARDRQPAAGAAAGRAAGRARPEAPRADAGRAEGIQAGRGDHLHLRHPRPGGGADDVGPHRRLQRGADRAGGPARGGLRAPANPFVAGFVGVSNLLERDGRRFTVRPGEGRMLANGEPPTGCTPSRAGSRRRLRGDDHPLPGRARSGRRRSKSSARTSRPPRRRRSNARGGRVVVGWRPEHTVAMAETPDREEKEEAL